MDGIPEHQQAPNPRRISVEASYASPGTGEVGDTGQGHGNGTSRSELDTGIRVREETKP